MQAISEPQAVPAPASGASAPAAAEVEIENLLATVRRRMLHVLDSRGVEPNLAEDLAQEGLVLVWRKLPQLRQPERVMSWAISILLNRLRSHCARGRPTLEVPEECPGTGEEPLEVMLRQEREAQCVRAVASLGPKMRAAILMRHGEGLTIEAASARLGVSESSLRHHLKSTLRRLRTGLGIRPKCRELRLVT